AAHIANAAPRTVRLALQPVLRTARSATQCGPVCGLRPPAPVPFSRIDNRGGFRSAKPLAPNGSKKVREWRKCATPRAGRFDTSEYESGRLGKARQQRRHRVEFAMGAHMGAAAAIDGTAADRGPADNGDETPAVGQLVEQRLG